MFWTEWQRVFIRFKFSLNFFMTAVFIYRLLPIQNTRVSLNNRNFIITFLQEYLQKLCLIFRHSPPASQHTWATCPQACGCPLEKSSTCGFTVSLATLTGLPLRCSSLIFCHLFWNLSTHSYTPLTQTTVSILNLHSYVDFRRFHTLWPQKTNNSSLLFHGASWHWSGLVVRPTAQAQTAWSSRPLYDILLRSHFVSRNRIFRCAYFSMHFRIKFLLFNDFPSYLLWGSCETLKYT